MFTNIADITLHCREYGWNNGSAEAVPKETIQVAELFLSFLEREPLSYEILALESGCIEITFFISTNAELHVVINEKTHLIGFFNGNIQFENSLNNSKIEGTSEAVKSFLCFYSNIYG